MKRYIKPEMDLITIKTEDIIQTSTLAQEVNGNKAEALNDVKNASGEIVTTIDMNVFE